MRERGRGLPRVGRGRRDAQPRRRDEPRWPELARERPRGLPGRAPRGAPAPCSSAASNAATCVADLDLELALDVLGGPLFYRLLITGGPIDEQLAEGVVELILRGFAPTSRAAGTVPKPKKEDHR